MLLRLRPQTVTSSYDPGELLDGVLSQRRFASMNRNPRIAVTLLIVLFMALLSYTGFVLFSGQQVPQPQLKVMVSPPGYPIIGTTWEVQVFQRSYIGQPWELAANSSVLMTTTGEGNFSFNANSGEVGITYTQSFGQVKFFAEKSGFESAVYRPQTVFFPNEVAYLVIGFYLFGGGLSVYEVSFEVRPTEKRSRFRRILTYCTLVSVSIGYILSVEWVQVWSFGTAWGFGNDILGGVSFFPHLFAITAISAFLSALLIGTTRRGRRE